MDKTSVRARHREGVVRKSLLCEFEPFGIVNKDTQIKEKIETLVQTGRSFWLHLEKPPKIFQRYLCERLNLPGTVVNSLFAQDTRPRHVKFRDGSLLIARETCAQKQDGGENDTASLRIWSTADRLITVTLQSSDAVADLTATLQEDMSFAFSDCFTMLLSCILHRFEEYLYAVDERLDNIEEDLPRLEEYDAELLNLRQRIIQLRRYMIPQRDAIMHMTQAVNTSQAEENMLAQFKDMSDTAVRQAETVNTLRDRARILQDYLVNQIVRKANTRVYLLSIFILSFAPAMFLMGLFSMNVPLPGAGDRWAFPFILLLIALITTGLFWLLKKKRWL